ncbi:hypothetical protein FQA39_LY04176 [Lamprigera yunnana]|nr:hypothetical protein FQA39_LY04176 [Lamprigera yunnana]
MLKPLFLLLLSGVFVATFKIADPTTWMTSTYKTTEASSTAYIETTTSGDLDPECPFPDPGGPGIYFPHETDCSLFYQCSNGYKILQKCPGDLVFNPDKNVCDFRDNTNCQDAAL